MSVESSVSRNDYVGNGTTATYDYLFKIFNQSDLQLIIRNSSDVETVLVLNTDYSVSDVGEDAGGSIVLIDSNQAWLDGSGFLDDNFYLSIRRTPQVIQSSDIKNQGDFYPEVYEAALDKLCFVDQKQQDEIDRSFKLAPSLDPDDYTLEVSGVPAAYQIPRINVSADGMEWADPETIGYDAASPTTTKGDIAVHNGSTNIRVPVGANNTYLKANSAEASGVAWTAPIVTTKGDISTFSTVEARLPVGANGKVLKADSTQPTGLIWGNAGGGGGSLQWIEADLAPVASLVSNFQVYEFEDALSQYLYASIRVPSTYTAGDQIKLLLTFYSAGTSGTALVQTSTTLIRTGTDLISSTTNQRTSTNSAVTLSGATASIPQAVILDLTSSSGQVNAVSVSPGDILLVRLTRDTTTDTTTSSVFVPVYGAETTFS